MRQSKRLQPIVAFKQRQEDEAAKHLAKVANEVTQQKQRLVDLESYRGEYDQQFHELGSLGVNAKRMKDYQRFMSSLAKALEQQKTAIIGLEKEFEEKKRQWLAARNGVKAINKVQTKYQKEEDSKEEKSQQKDQDDRSSRSVRN